MTAKHKAGIVLLAAAALGAALYGWWVHNAPRRASLDTLTRLDAALHSGNRAELLDLLVIPAAVRGRSAPEQSEFLAKALKDEISPQGVAVLRRRGAYGPLKKIFPAEAEGWAAQAGIKADDCVAFRLERHGLRAEVVLLKPSTLNEQPSTAEQRYRIVRVNNVKQLADSNVSTSEKTP